jgi:hypothetical protein
LRELLEGIPNSIEDALPASIAVRCRKRLAHSWEVVNELKRRELRDTELRKDPFGFTRLVGPDLQVLGRRNENFLGAALVLENDAEFEEAVMLELIRVGLKHRNGGISISIGTKQRALVFDSDDGSADVGQQGEDQCAEGVPEFVGMDVRLKVGLVSVGLTRLVNVTCGEASSCNFSALAFAAAWKLIVTREANASGQNERLWFSHRSMLVYV